jgi:hypothetical protein
MNNNRFAKGGRCCFREHLTNLLGIIFAGALLPVVNNDPHSGSLGTVQTAENQHLKFVLLKYHKRLFLHPIPQ